MSTDRFFLSNGFASTVKWGVEYASVFHAFVAAHYRPHDLRNDTPELQAYRRQVAACKTAREVRTVLFSGKHLWRADMKAVEERIMEALLRQKFAAGTELARKLAAVEDTTIEAENEYHDNYWGVCVCEDCQLALAEHPTWGNRLGRLLTRIRDELRMAERPVVEDEIPV